MTRSPSLVIAVTCAFAVCVAGTAAAVGAAPAGGTAAPSKTLPGPTDPFPTASVATTSTSTTVPVTLAGITIPAGTVQLTDTTRHIRVNVPNTWTDTSTSPSIRDDGGVRPTVSASVDVAQFRSGWSVPGMWMVAVDPSLEPDVLLGNNLYNSSCRDGGVEPFSNEHFTGLRQRWSDCGGRATQLLIVSGRPPDGSATVLLQLQTLSPDDPAVDLVLDSFSMVPGAEREETVAASQPPTVGDVPPSLLHAATPPDAQRLEDSGHHLAVTVPADWTETDIAARTNDDYSNRPFILAAPELDSYPDFGAGIVAQVLPYRDPSIPLTLFGYDDGTCTDAGVQTFRTAQLTGYLQTWTACGGTNARAIILAASPADHSATIVLEVHLADADNTPLALALSTLELE